MNDIDEIRKLVELGAEVKQAAAHNAEAWRLSFACGSINLDYDAGDGKCQAAEAAFKAALKRFNEAAAPAMPALARFLARATAAEEVVEAARDVSNSRGLAVAIMVKRLDHLDAALATYDARVQEGM